LKLWKGCAFNADNEKKDFYEISINYKPGVCRITPGTRLGWSIMPVDRPSHAIPPVNPKSSLMSLTASPYYPEEEGFP